LYPLDQQSFCEVPLASEGFFVPGEGVSVDVVSVVVGEDVLVSVVGALVVAVNRPFTQSLKLWLSTYMSTNPTMDITQQQHNPTMMSVVLLPPPPPPPPLPPPPLLLKLLLITNHYRNLLRWCTHCVWITLKETVSRSCEFMNNGVFER